jgi:hypothetical protein
MDHDAGRSRSVALRRSPVRLALTVAVRAAVGGASLVTGLQVGGGIGVPLTIVGAVVLAYSALLALVVSSARLELHPGEIHLVTAIGRRRYQLQRGPITRLALRRRRGSLAVQLGFLGLMIGRARLGGEELAGVLSLARTDELVLVPTTAGRLGIAPRDESDLLGALRSAGDIRSSATEH